MMKSLVSVYSHPSVEAATAGAGGRGTYPSPLIECHYWDHRVDDVDLTEGSNLISNNQEHPP